MKFYFIYFFFFILSSCVYNEITLDNNIDCRTNETPSFQNCIQPLINVHCIRCHSVTSNSGSLDGYEAVKNMVLNKNLIGRIQLDMPPNGLMAEEEINIFIKWVNNGSLDN